MTSAIIKFCASTLVLLACLCVTDSLAAQNALGELFPPSIPRAIERGLKPDGDLEEELESIQYEPITTTRQAKAVVQLLKALPLPPPAVVGGQPYQPQKFYDPLYSLSVRRLLNNIAAESPASNHIRQHGTPEIYRIYDYALAQYKSADEAREGRAGMALTQWLSACAELQTEEGSDRVIEALKQNIAPDNHGWRSILEVYDFSHPQAKRVYAYLAENIPEGELGYSVLSATNYRASDENTFDHIYDSDRGVAALKKYLQDDEGVMRDVIAALPHLNPARQTELYKLIDAKPNIFARLGSARAKAEDDDPLGVKQLAELCLNVRVSKQAQDTLKELDKESHIPAAVHRRPFALEAAVYGELLDAENYYDSADESEIVELEVVEELNVPSAPGDEPLKGTLVRFKVKYDDDPLTVDRPGIAIIADTTFCYIDESETYLSHEDLVSAFYFEKRLQQFSSNEYLPENELPEYLKQWNGPKWESTAVYKCTFDELVDYPSKAVVFGYGTLEDVDGIMVLDDTRSHFYPAKQFHSATGMFQILRVHCGRVARGLPVNIERPDFTEPNSTVPPELVIQHCEGWLAELKTASLERRRELLGIESVLLLHLMEYVDALAGQGKVQRDEALLAVVDQLFAAERSVHDQDPKQPINLLVFDEIMHDYVRSPKLDVAKAAERFEWLLPRCDSIYEVEWVARLGMRAGKNEQAQKLLEEHLFNHREFNANVLFTLTELLVSQGQEDRAVQLHVQAYQDLIRRASKLDLELNDWLDEEVEGHLKKMREQIPSRYEAALAEAGIDGDFKTAVQNYRKKKSKRS